jgi:hypothetical protein
MDYNSLRINSKEIIIQNHYVFSKECTLLCFNHTKVNSTAKMINGNVQSFETTMNPSHNNKVIFW